MTKDERLAFYIFVITATMIFIALILRVGLTEDSVLNLERADRAATATAEVKPAE